MKHNAEWAILSLGLLLVSLSGIQLMRPVAESAWIDWVSLDTGILLVIAGILRLIE